MHDITSVCCAPAIERHLLTAGRRLRCLAACCFVHGPVAKHDTLVVAYGGRLVAALLGAGTPAAVVRRINAVHTASHSPRHHNVLGHLWVQQGEEGCLRRLSTGNKYASQREAPRTNAIYAVEEMAFFSVEFR